MSPLASATEYEHLEIMELLIDIGADANFICFYGSCCLAVAIEEDNMSGFRILSSLRCFLSVEQIWNVETQPKIPPYRKLRE